VCLPPTSSEPEAEGGPPSTCALFDASADVT
jgi:hypothetical protein